MFKEVTFGEWGQWVAVVAFAASLAVFLFFVISALRMPKGKVKHDSELPLEDENQR